MLVLHPKYIKVLSFPYSSCFARMNSCLECPLGMLFTSLNLFCHLLDKDNKIIILIEAVVKIN